MRRFECHRTQDVSGVSGTGVVAQGCVFDSGKVVIAWLTEVSSVTMFDSLEDVIKIHGHGGATEFVFLDIDPQEASRTMRQIGIVQAARQRTVKLRKERNACLEKYANKSFDELTTEEQEEYGESDWRAREAQSTMLKVIDRFVADKDPIEIVKA